MRQRRTGLTLIEVLTAIFIAGIGLLALLTLFPLGAMNMAQSVQDDRVGHIKESALAISIAHDFRTDPYVVAAMTNPGGGLAQIPSGYNGPSYPVFVDPLGDRYNGGAYKQWVGGAPQGLRRCGVDFLTPSPTSRDPNMRTVNPAYQNQQLLKWCTLLDDMEFDRDGTTSLPGTPVGAPVSFERAPRFSWAWVLRQGRAYDNDTAETQCVVYAGRTLVPNTGETIYAGTVDGTANTILLTYDPAGQDRPNVKPGTWLLDIGMSPTPRGYFYRAIGVEEIAPGTLTIEVQNRPTTGIVTATTRIAVMDNVVEVTNPYRY